MKKILALMLALTLAMSLVACGAEEKEVEVTEEAAEEVVEETTEEAAPAEEAAEEAAPAEEAAEEAAFDPSEMVGSWTLVAATTPEGEDDFEAVLGIYEGTFDMNINEDGTITWNTGVADFEGAVVEIAEDGSAMMQFVNGDNVLQLGAIVEEGSLVLVDGSGCGYVLEAK